MGEGGGRGDDGIDAPPDLFRQPPGFNVIDPALIHKLFASTTRRLAFCASPLMMQLPTSCNQLHHTKPRRTEDQAPSQLCRESTETFSRRKRAPGASSKLCLLWLFFVVVVDVVASGLVATRYRGGKNWKDGVSVQTLVAQVCSICLNLFGESVSIPPNLKFFLLFSANVNRDSEQAGELVCERDDFI